MSNTASTVYAKERASLIKALETDVYNLKFPLKELALTLANLSEIYTAANRCIPMAVAAKDFEFEKACRDLQHVLHAGIPSVRQDNSAYNRLEFAREIEAAVPLSIRDPAAYARNLTFQRYGLVKK